MMGLGRPDVLMVRIKNTGKSRISAVAVSSLELADATTKHRASLPTIIKNDLGINPEMDAIINVNLPKPVLAGTYSGVLDLQANGRERKSIFLTLRTRGPNYIPLLSRFEQLSYLPWLPFVLFVATLLLGFWLSKKLENWFRLGGLHRAQAILSLRESRDTLQGQINSVRELRGRIDATRPDLFDTIEAILEHSQQEAANLFAAAAAPNAEQPSLEVLSENSSRLKDRVAFTKVFIEKMQLAVDLYDSADDRDLLIHVVRTLDAQTPTDEAISTSNPKIYRNQLDTRVRAAREDRGVAALAARPNLEVVANKLKDKIDTMNLLSRLLLWIVVILIAYQTFYANNLAFGTLLDYVAVFLWSFGLTQFGTQVIERVRPTQAKTQA
jgi:hypothetical protein